MQALLLLVGGLLLALAARASIAQNVAPNALVKSVTHQVIGVIRSNSDAHDPATIARLVEAEVVPHVEFVRMTRLALGRSWRLASPEQQQVLIAEFRTPLVRTYSASLAGYRNQEIDFVPLRSAPGDTEVTVRSMVKQPGGQPIRIDYDMERDPAGWRVYNLRIDGMSLVLTYRDTFADQVMQHGVDGLIKALAAKNRLNSLGTSRDGG